MGNPMWCVLLCIVLFSGAGCSTGQSTVFGLRPVYPAATEDHAKVDSLHPTLRWESFPRPADLRGDNDGWVGRTRTITYDLRIWRSERGMSEKSRFPGDLVYSRNGLPEPAHRVEWPLTRDTQYVWSIRARFELDGNLRVTEWGMLKPRDPLSRNSGAGTPWVYTADPRSPYLPNWAYYRLRTP